MKVSLETRTVFRMSVVVVGDEPLIRRKRRLRSVRTSTRRRTTWRPPPARAVVREAE